MTAGGPLAWKLGLESLGVELELSAGKLNHSAGPVKLNLRGVQVILGNEKRLDRPGSFALPGAALLPTTRSKAKPSPSLVPAKIGTVSWTMCAVYSLLNCKTRAAGQLDSRL